ncbi:hypothetical protein PIB30_081299, partial [Stylosanthes scabra]|nr:hypothetical protein [Stylosanthes scabra]
MWKIAPSKSPKIGGMCGEQSSSTNKGEEMLTSLKAFSSLLLRNLLVTQRNPSPFQPLTPETTTDHQPPPSSPQTHPASSHHYFFSLSHPHSHTGHHHPRQSASHTKQLQCRVPACCHLIPSPSQQHCHSDIAVFKLAAVSASLSSSE